MGSGRPWLEFCRLFHRPSNRISSYRPRGVLSVEHPESPFSASSTRRILMIAEEIGVSEGTVRTARKQSGSQDYEPVWAMTIGHLVVADDAVSWNVFAGPGTRQSLAS